MLYIDIYIEDKRYGVSVTKPRYRDTSYNYN